MQRGPVPSLARIHHAAGLLIAVLGCATPRSPEPTPEPEPTLAPAPAPAPAPACEPAPLDELADTCAEIMDTYDWRYVDERSRLYDSSVELAFDKRPHSAFIGVAIASPLDDVEVALRLPNLPDVVPLTAEALVDIGERASGYTLSRTISVDHPRGTRRQKWTFSEVTFVACRVVVRVGGEMHPEEALRIAHEIDGWMTRTAR